MRITLVRHGNADAAASPDHRLRPLSEKGKAQAAARREKLGNPQFDLVCHSILDRTRETAMIIAGETYGVPFITLPGLFYKKEDRRGEAVDRAFSKLGHDTLRAYLNEAESEIMSLAKETAKAVQLEIAETEAQNMLIVGHGILLQALASCLTGQDEPFISRICGECEGFVIKFDQNGSVPDLGIEELV